MAAEALQPFICGGVSAMFASVCIHPIDLVKVRIQLVGQGSKVATPSAISIARTIISHEGVRGLYSGLTAALTRQATYGTARIGLHRVFSDQLIVWNSGQNIPFYQKTLSGLASGAIAVCIGTPFDVALVRMQNDGSRPVADRRNYRNVFDALIRITREEGITKLWRGLTPNILRGMSMNVGMLACYDQAKQVIAKLTDDVSISNPKMSTKLGSSAVAGFCCAFLSLPFDMMKSRLQNMRIDPVTGKLPYTGVVDCSTKILRHEGPLAFWKGFWAYYGRCAPHAMIILLTVEQVTHLYREFFGLEENLSHLITAQRFTSTGTLNMDSQAEEEVKGDTDEESD